MPVATAALTPPTPPTPPTRPPSSLPSALDSPSDAAVGMLFLPAAPPSLLADLTPLPPLLLLPPALACSRPRRSWASSAAPPGCFALPRAIS